MGWKHQNQDSWYGKSGYGKEWDWGYYNRSIYKNQRKFRRTRSSAPYVVCQPCGRWEYCSSEKVSCQKCGKVLSDGYGGGSDREHGFTAGHDKKSGEGTDHNAMDTDEQQHTPEVQQLVDQLSRLVQKDVGKLLLQHLPLPPKVEDQARSNESEMFRRFRTARGALAKAGDQRQQASAVLAKARAAFEKAEENFNGKAEAEKEAEGALATAKGEYFRLYPQEAAEEESREAQAREAEAIIRRQQAEQDAAAEEQLQQQRRNAEEGEETERQAMEAEIAAAANGGGQPRQAEPPAGTEAASIAVHQRGAEPASASNRDIARSRSPVMEARSRVAAPGTVLGEAAKHFEHRQWADEYGTGWQTPGDQHL